MKTFPSLWFLLCFILSMSVINTHAQGNLLQIWSIGDPLSYMKWYDNGTFQFDSLENWSYRHGSSNAIIFSDANDVIAQSNGCKIVNKQLAVIENGDSIVDALYYSDYDPVGDDISQGVVALPRDKDTWWVFNMSFSDSAWYDATHGTPSVFSPDRLYAAIVDVKANNGAGKVLAKKIPVYKGVMGDCRLTACRHANGRDWWLINHGWNNSIYNKWLVTPDSIYGVFRDTIGTLHQELDLYGMAQFSLDGKKYVMGSSNGLVNIFDFDRCTGQFSNLKTINVYPEPPYIIAPYISSVTGICFSPSSRFVYATSFDYLLQYDTWADSIDSTRVLLAKTDSTFKNPDPLFTMALTPHNTIIIANFQGLPPFCNYHTIQYPDSAGFSCGFQKESLYIPSSYSNYTLPNLPNLKLGVDTGSLCDTLRVGLAPLSFGEGSGVRLFPNPANDKVFIEAENNNYAIGELTVTDNLGKLVYQNKNYDGATVINVLQWPNGIYFYLLKSKNYGQSGKFIVQH